MTKSELRKIYLARQKMLTNKERIKLSLQICENFFSHFLLENINIFHVFLPIEKNSEIKTSFIINRLHKRLKKIVVPRVNFETNEIENVEFRPDSPTTLNKWHISEPEEITTVEAQKVDLVIVPLLCFDESGFRVGYGKGFYDRFLEKCRADCLKIGLSYFSPVTKISDAQNFDVKLNFCVTPEEIFDINKKSF
jgi:5-formyltetrahydrofolate cyclo-ligase